MLDQEGQDQILQTVFDVVHFHVQDLDLRHTQDLGFKCLRTYPDTFQLQKLQDVVIMTKKGFAFKVINASLITEMMQL